MITDTQKHTLLCINISHVSSLKNLISWAIKHRGIIVCKILHTQSPLSSDSNGICTAHDTMSNWTHSSPSPFHIYYIPHSHPLPVDCRTVLRLETDSCQAVFFSLRLPTPHSLDVAATPFAVVAIFQMVNPFGGRQAITIEELLSFHLQQTQTDAAVFYKEVL